jgi:hypothetical protein
MASPVVLMYSHSPRAFASALVGHLYELCGSSRVTLLTEPLPPPYSRVIARPGLFPGLQEIVVVPGMGYSVRAMLTNSRIWFRLIERTLDRVSPDIVVGENDNSGLFDMYLMREARRRGIPTISFQAMGQGQFPENQQVIEARHVAKQARRYLPSTLLRIKYRIRRRLGHTLVHHLIPIATAQRPLLGGSSYVLMSGAPGMRDSDLHVTQSRSQFEVCAASGTPREKLAILDHPASRVPREAFFPQSVSPVPQGPDRKPFALVLIGAVAAGIHRVSGSVILPKTRLETRKRVLELLMTELPGWNICIKAHPMVGTKSSLKPYLPKEGTGMVILDPKEPAEFFLPRCSLVIDLPPGWSSALATAAAARPRTPVISADLDEDVLGDIYANWPGVEYVGRTKVLRNLLQKICADRYKRTAHSTEAAEGYPVFQSTMEAVKSLL